MSGPRDWHDPEPYRELERLPAGWLAWEALRRNPDYRQDFAAADTPEQQEVIAHRWGLRFRGRSRA
jgi:hypothetical protein